MSRKNLLTPVPVRTLLIAVLFGLGFHSSLLTSHPGNAARASDNVVSDRNLSSAGLISIWFTNAGVGSGREIVDWTLNVNENKSTTFYEIEAGNFYKIISEHTISPFGKPFGQDGAVEYIEVQKEILAAELAAAGRENIEIKTRQFSLPKSTIYVLGVHGTLTAIDAESGHHDWSATCGTHKLPSIGVGASNQHVAAINGSTLYCLDAATGKMMWSHPCEYGVAAPPAVTADRIYVPLLSGRMEIFEIDRNGLGSYSLVAGGTATARPLATNETVSWPTNKGELNVAPSVGINQHSVGFRLMADGGIESSPVEKGNLIFATSLDGFVYALNEHRGTLAWEVSTGTPISQSPAVVGDSVYVICDDTRMFRIDALTGEQLWAKPIADVKKYVGASRDRIYAMDKYGNMLVINPESAAVMSRVQIGDVRLTLANRETDRLYIATKTGIIQCIHEKANKIPFFHADEIAAIKPIKTKQENATPTEDTEEAVDIKVEDDPFKALESEPAANDEPDSDPFGK